MSGREFTIGINRKVESGAVVSVHALFADGRHVCGVRCCVIRESTFDQWVSSIRDVCGREPMAWEIESVQTEPCFFYVATTD